MKLATFSLDNETLSIINKIAQDEDRNKSSVLRLAIKQLNSSRGVKHGKQRSS